MRHLLKNKNGKGVPLITNCSPKLPISEQYRLIRTNILFSAVDKEIKTIMVTSPDFSEGKSTTAANLAIVLAQQGKHVLLVDTDLRKPSVHFTFNVSNILGLTNILTKEITLDRGTLKTGVLNLEILTSGPIPRNPSELLHSNAMDVVLRKLKNIYDYIIFDTPPVLDVTDAQIMANQCDGVIMVIASGKTNKDRALEAKGILEKAQSELLGVIVNGVEAKRNKYYRHYR